ncbi:hypothetical protein HYPBUDRAFT_3780 [Hyphopichia burtonii NRRL Y-1933]|uniref:Retrotransposon gag domain-containing protein n=1 Tax=Hyphopichia burtonii NRRL Y-1933 TaxID=984485 RepID=A0A1E4RRG4_9ASCO|nr:hypothetical protein HYPBUDRAFT_3780 [Hyphopichia burtonii NRRL Y-1933]ODV69852.1 hypothetical protein HYPBUDRAFT_3780 [Hyphopichia burtonii NRRL Y-1933]
MSPTKIAATQGDPELKMSARKVLKHLIDSRGLIPTQCYIPTLLENLKKIFDFGRRSAFEIRRSLSYLEETTSVYAYADKFFSICGEFVDEELGDPEIIATFIGGLKPYIKAAIRAKDGTTSNLMETVGLAKDLDTWNSHYTCLGEGNILIVMKHLLAETIKLKTIDSDTD